VGKSRPGAGLLTETLSQIGLNVDTPFAVTIASCGLGHVARGIEAWAADLGRALFTRGLRVTLCKGGGTTEAAYERVVPCWQRNSAQTESLLRRMPRSLGWRLGLGAGYGVEQTTFALHLLSHLRRDRVDILHVQDPQVALIVQRAAQVGWVRTRTILAHGTEESLAFQSKLKYLQQLAPWHLEEARAAGVSKPTWTAIPNFIDTELFQPGRADALRRELGIPPNALVVLTAAAIKRRHKRVDYLLSEVARLRLEHPDLPVWLVVAGGWEAETDKLVEEGRHVLGDRVRFLVRFPRSRMPDLYRLADVFVLCSLKEMMPIALLEATASGLPCLVHQHPVMEWMVGPGGNALDLAAPGALAATLWVLLQDVGARTALGRAARQHCLEHFSRERVVNQILDYYDFVLTHDRSPQKAKNRFSVEEVQAAP
jgi:1,2-diacylglycerol 3-alpha-glucosyltransferase